MEINGFEIKEFNVNGFELNGKINELFKQHAYFVHQLENQRINVVR